MATGFQAFRILEFPKDEVFQSVEQIPLLADSEQNMEETSTVVRRRKAP